jgi:tetratricopeptide (TPR) repeat protein
LLCTLAEVDLESQTDDALQVVEELGRLPLAIDQAAAYVRTATATRKFSEFLDDYRKSRPELHEWVPAGSRQYSRSVANTWAMSFKYLQDAQPTTAKLFQILSFLNPDLILIDFIIAGSAAFEEDLRTLVTDNIKLKRGLLSLESLSLVKWSRETNALSIHRVIQAVVEDQLPKSSLDACGSTVIEVCDTGFPRDWQGEEAHAVRRRFGTQVVQPLLRLGKLRMKKLGIVSSSIGSYMTIQGKFSDAKKLHLQAVDILSNVCLPVCADDEVVLLKAQVELANCHRDDAEFKEALELLQTTLDGLRMLLGEDHYETLRAMYILGLTYCSMGLFVEGRNILLAVAGAQETWENEIFEADVMQALGDACRVQGRFSEATALFERTLALTAETFWKQPSVDARIDGQGHHCTCGRRKIGSSC